MKRNNAILLFKLTLSVLAVFPQSVGITRSLIYLLISHLFNYEYTPSRDHEN